MGDSFLFYEFDLLLEFAGEVHDLYQYFLEVLLDGAFEFHAFGEGLFFQLLVDSLELFWFYLLLFAGFGVALDELYLAACGLDQKASIVVQLLADIVRLPYFDRQFVIAFVLGSDKRFIQRDFLFPQSLCGPRPASLRGSEAAQGIELRIFIPLAAAQSLLLLLVLHLLADEI